MTNHETIALLLYRHSQGTLSDEEAEQLEAWKNASQNNAALIEALEDEESLSMKIADFHPENKQQLRDSILTQVMMNEQHKVPVVRTSWWKYAAAAIIILGLGAYLWTTQQQETPAVVKTEVPVQNDVAPGGNKATLTLANGQKIVLDTLENGNVNMGSQQLLVKKDGLLEYSRESSSVIPSENSSVIPSDRSVTPSERSEARNPVFHTLTTPRGGQFQLTLSDGTKAWLNAASSITYPTVFQGKERSVTITGEVYFEVAKDKKKKFIVNVDDRQRVEVLGTHFNINAYKDERSINTTLIEGSIRLTPHPSPLTKNNLGNKRSPVHTSLTLKPGQQGQLDNKRLSLAVHPDVEQAVAWKNGVLNFNNVSLEQAMRQIARWYDVEVVYEKGIPDVKFGGRLGSDLSLSQVTKALEMAGLQFRIEGKKLIVAP